MAWKSTREAPPCRWAWPDGTEHDEIPIEEREACLTVDQVIGGVRGLSVLDFGAGKGACLRVADSSGAGALIAVDESPGALRICRRVFGGRALNVLCENNRVPLPDGIADVVWSHGVVEHMEGETLREYVAEATRLAARWVAFSAPNPMCRTYREFRAHHLERETWCWGFEEPVVSYSPWLEACGLTTVFDGDIGRSWRVARTYAIGDNRWHKRNHETGACPGIYTLVVARK